MPGHLQIIFDRPIIQTRVTVYRPIGQQLTAFVLYEQSRLYYFLDITQILHVSQLVCDPFMGATS